MPSVTVPKTLSGAADLRLEPEEKGLLQYPGDSLRSYFEIQTPDTRLIQYDCGKLQVIQVGSRLGCDLLVTSWDSISGLLGLAFSRPKNDKFGLFYIGWPGHFLEFIKYLAFFKVYRSFYSKVKPFFLF